MKPQITLRQGILDRLKEVRGIANDESMARLGGVSLNTYKSYRDGKTVPSWEFIALICTAFGMSVGEMVTLQVDHKAPTAA